MCDNSVNKVVHVLAAILLVRIVGQPPKNVKKKRFSRTGVLLFYIVCCAIFADIPAVLSSYPRISNGRGTLLVSLARRSQKTGMLLKTVAHALMLRAHAYFYSNPTSSSHLVANHLHRSQMPAVGPSTGQYRRGYPLLGGPLSDVPLYMEIYRVSRLT